MSGARRAPGGASPAGKKRKRKEAPRVLAETPVATLLTMVLAPRGLQGMIDSQRAVLLWPEVVGPRIAARTSADRLDQDTLHVTVATAAWMQELTMLLPGLQARLRAAVGPSAAKLTIRLKLAAGKVVDQGRDPRVGDLASSPKR